MMREEEEEASIRQPKVSMVGWSADDQYAAVACSDFAVRVWHTGTGQLVHVLQVSEHSGRQAQYTTLFHIYRCVCVCVW